MADDHATKQQDPREQLSHDEQYLKLLKGEITSTEFVEGLKDRVRQRDRATGTTRGSRRERAANA